MHHSPSVSPSPSTSTPEVILRGRRLLLSPVQARWLAVLLARAGQLVPDSELLLAPGQGQPAWHHITDIRSAILPHGFVLYRVKRQGFVLLPEPEQEEA